MKQATILCQIRIDIISVVWVEIDGRKGREVESYKRDSVRERSQSTTLAPLGIQCRVDGHGSEEPEVKLRGERIHSWEWLLIPTNPALRRLKQWV